MALSQILVDSSQPLLLELAHVQGVGPRDAIVIAAKLLPGADYHDVASADGGLDEVLQRIPGKFPEALRLFDVLLDARRIAVFAR